MSIICSRFKATPRRWSDKEIKFLREHVGKLTHAEIGTRLRRPTTAVKSAAKRMSLTKYELFSKSERQFVLDNAATMTAVQIAAKLEWPVRSIYNLRHRLGICRKQASFGRDFRAFLRAKHRAGWSDMEICTAWGCDRHAVGVQRQKLGLGINNLSDHRRRRVAEKTAEQLRKAGLPSIGHLRVEAFKKRARDAGWPEDLRPRAVQMLNALWQHGPMTRRQLAHQIGMRWKGSRQSLTSNDLEGSYLAHLIKRGLVITLGRIHKVTGKGPGRSCQIYTLPLGVERGKVPSAS